MDLILTNANDDQRRHFEAVVGEGTLRTAADETGGTWPLAVVFLGADMASVDEIADARGAVGLDTVLIGVGAPPGDLVPDLIGAGLDDLVGGVEEFARRRPFFAARLRQRAQRHLRLAAILENTVDGIVVINDRGIVQSINRAVTRIFGYESAELVGKNVSKLMPPPDKDRHDAYLARYLTTGEPRIIGIGREVVGRRKDGALFPLDLAVSEAVIEGRSVFAGVVRDISERRRLENEVLKVSEEERRRIGHDLHDGLGQMLTGTGLIARNIARRMEAEGQASAPDVKEVAELIREADEQARALAQGLVPVELDRNGLSAALARLSTQAERLFGGACEFDRRVELRVANATAAVNLYRIAQEAVSNAFKHGKADRVRIVLAADEDFIRLRVEDNGLGFQQTVSDQGGMGVRIMHYRAGVIGGQLQIHGQPDKGTTVSADIPRAAIEKELP